MSISAFLLLAEELIFSHPVCMGRTLLIHQEYLKESLTW